ncbi:uncharacterized protein N7487_003655 [Penicillium crustosum]|uniref:uncharacterized protein n=1 Tax=Penicillium crustosum TaxID=36656 RepID=UPI00239E5673|nr:uncharacterized protein N7487_003655 [Penicillium crustosum]KAJ5409296.1 hypothetical protein N7487_003655 [Penicillium crustosum]
MGYIGIVGYCLHNQHSGLHLSLCPLTGIFDPVNLLSPKLAVSPNSNEFCEVHRREKIVFVHPPWLAPALLFVLFPVVDVA